MKKRDVKKGTLIRKGVLADGEEVEARSPEQAQAIALSEREGMDLLPALEEARQDGFRALGEAIAKLDLSGIPKLGYVECKADGTVKAKKGFEVRKVKPGVWELDIVHKLATGTPVIHTVPSNKQASPVLEQRNPGAPDARLHWTIELRDIERWHGPRIDCDFSVYTTDFMEIDDALRLGGIPEEDVKRLVASTGIGKVPDPPPSNEE